MSARRTSWGRSAGARNSSIAAYPSPVAATRPMFTRRKAFLRTSSGFNIEKAARACLRCLSIGLTGLLRAGQTEHHVQLPSPFYRQANSLHMDERCEKIQYGLGSWMKIEARRDEQKAWGVRAEGYPRKVAMRRKFRPIEV